MTPGRPGLRAARRAGRWPARVHLSGSRGWLISGAGAARQRAVSARRRLAAGLVAYGAGRAATWGPARLGRPSCGGALRRLLGRLLRRALGGRLHAGAAFLAAATFFGVVSSPVRPPLPVPPSSAAAVAGFLAAAGLRGLRLLRPDRLGQRREIRAAGWGSRPRAALGRAPVALGVARVAAAVEGLAHPFADRAAPSATACGELVEHLVQHPVALGFEHWSRWAR